jgi:tetratricopeptide (TPR) repeat protein
VPRAIEEYRKGLAIDPKDTTARYNLIAALELSGDFEGVVKELQQLSELQPDDVQVAAHLANAVFRLSRYQEAASAFEKVLRLDPGRADHYYNLGLCYFYMENWDATLATWLTALAHDPKHAATNKGLAVVYWKRRDYKQAWETVARCQTLGIALDPAFVADLQRDSGQKGP